MDKPKQDGPQNGDGVQHTTVPMLTITYDPRTFGVAIGGTVPSWEFAEAMLHMAVKETERKIQERRIQTGIAVAGPELLAHLTGKQ